MINIKETGGAALVAHLTNVARKVPETARKTMNRAAERIVKQARINAPADKHNLENSIRLARGYAQDTGRLQLQIMVGGYVGGVDVNEYAIEVENNYDDEHPGEETKAKRIAFPNETIGKHFLQRAVDKERPKLERDIVRAVISELRD